MEDPLLWLWLKEKKERRSSLLDELSPHFGGVFFPDRVVVLLLLLQSEVEALVGARVHGQRPPPQQDAAGCCAAAAASAPELAPAMSGAMTTAAVWW